MDWIDINSFRFDAESQNEVVLFGDYSWTGKLHNPEGVTECSHGIYPVEMRNRIKKVSLETVQRGSNFGINLFILLKTVVVSSLSGLFFFVNPFYLGLKSETTFERPCQDFSFLLDWSGKLSDQRGFFSSKTGG